MNSNLAMEIEKNNILQVYSRFPVVLDYGCGSKVYDLEGKEYIDMTSGIGVSSLGHNNEKIKKALLAQIDKILHTSNVFYNAQNIELASLLTNASNMCKVFFSNSGAEANECAIKLARKYGNDKCSGKNKIITLKQSFHGRTITTLAATGQDKYHKYFNPFTEGFEYIEMGNLDELKEKIDGNVCAIMLEAIQGEGGIHPINKSFAKEVEKICIENDILLIFDEVQCGIGRTGHLFAYEYLDVKPNIVTAAKGLGAGIPIGAVLCDSKLQSVFQKGDHGSTFGGNPVACAAAIEVIKTVTDEAFLKEVINKGEYINKKIKSIDTDKIKEVRGKGLMLGVELNCEVKEIINSCIEKGALFLSAGTKVVRMLPPLTISYEEIDKAINTLEKSLS